MGVSNTEIISRITAAWTERAGRDPATLLVGGSAPFRIREVDGTLVVTSHVTGSSYELPLPVDDENLGLWLGEIVGYDVFLFEQRRD